MKPVLSKIIFISFFAIFISNVYSQEVNADTVQPELDKNTVYGSIGSFGLSFILYNINLERTLWNTSGFISNIRARLGGGEWVGGWSEDEGTHFIGTINALTGSRAFHLELNLGAAYFHDKTDDEYAVLPAAALGFRIQKPGGYFVFRLGGGYPEGVYLSLGIAF